MKYNYLNDNFKLYTIEDLQHILKVSRSFAYKLVSTGEIKCVRIHRLLRITPWALAEYMNSLSPEDTTAQLNTVKSYFSNSAQYYTIQELQEILQICDSFIRQLLYNNELVGKRMYREIRISSESLYQFISSHEK